MFIFLMKHSSKYLVSVVIPIDYNIIAIGI